MSTGNEKIKQYLLGNLTPDEAREMDLRIISGASLEDELLAAEDDLMDDYLDGILSPADAELFRRNFLVSDERRAALQHLAGLKKYARNFAARRIDKEPTGAPTGGWLDDLKSIFMLNMSPAKALLALTLLVAAGGVGWRVFFYDPGRGNLARAEQEAVRLSREDLSDLSRLENVRRVNLAAGTFRSSEASDQISAPAPDTRVLFRLALPLRADSNVLYKARLVGEGRDVLALERVRSYENQNGRELRILLPASIIKKGDYRIEVADENAASPIVYSFAIR